jgi:N-carbamoyl-L-amino-acid hydrolase
VFTVDLRNTDEATLARAEAEVHAFAAQCAAAQGVACSHRQLARFEPVVFDPMVTELIAQETQALGLPALRLPSGAGHDAQMLARVCPSGMIFVPSVNGLSHNVKEFTAPDDLAQGAQVLLQVLVRLAQRGD